MLHVARFLAAYARAPSGLREAEQRIATEEGEIAATLVRPAGSQALPGWVVLHGITVPGRRHPVLQRFARALAAAGNAVLLPEVRAWCELRIAPDLAEKTIAAAARHLAAQDGVRPGGVSVVGFSFGATQALITAARADLAAPIRAVVSFGGYCDLGRAMHFMLTGEHEWQGRRFRLPPDPYGRWIAIGNYLAAVPEYAGMDGVAAAALELAADAGRNGAYADHPVYDPLKARMRARFAGRERDLWDLIAAPSGSLPPPEPAHALASQLTAAALRLEPGLDPAPVLPHLAGRVVLAHGRMDRLLPFTETLRIRALLPPEARVHTAVTRLFAHSRGADALPLRQYPREALRYVRLLDAALRP